MDVGLAFWVRGSKITMPIYASYERSSDPKLGIKFAVYAGQVSFETEYMDPSTADEFEQNFKRAKEAFQEGLTFKWRERRRQR